MDIDIADEANNDVTDEEPRLYYANVEQFVTQMLAQQYRRPVDLAGRGNTFTWCSKWWLHAEAVSRLTALWRAWEASRLDPTTGMIIWWRDHVDATMRVLFAQDGPFAGCTPREHKPTTIPLPLIAPPAGLFDLD